jgi:hypothetical protein
MTIGIRTYCGLLAIAAGLVLSTTGCDSVEISDDSPDLVRPSISVHFANGASILPKTMADVTVSLKVSNLSGDDFSPAPITVDDEVVTEVRFELLLLPDSVYWFEVEFTQGELVVGEGATVQLVTEEAAQVEIQAVAIGASQWFALVPAEVEVPVSSDSLDIVMKYYGDGNPVSGLAAMLSATNGVGVRYLKEGTGGDACPLAGPPAPIEEGEVVSLGWQFSTPCTAAVVELGSIRVPLTTEFCLDAATFDVRTVDPAGEIRLIESSGACINVTP